MADRIAQLNYLIQVASDISSNNWDGTPDEIVDFWIAQVEADPDATMPDWLDAHDRFILIRMVEAEQA